jgi:hypothetical protein
MSTTSLLSGGGSGRRNLPNQASFATTTTTTTTTTMNNYSGSRTIPVSLTPTTPRCACQRPSKETTMMALCMGVVILTSAGERASFKMMIDAMKPFRFFLTQLITLIYVPIMFAIVSYKKLRTPDIQPEMEEFSKCKFAFMALLDVVHLSIVTISGGIIPAPLTVLLLQSSVPATMFVSRYFLGHQYQWTHYTSSLMILIGLSIYMIPMVQSVTTNQVPSNRTHAVFSASASASAFSPSFSFSSSTPLSPSPSLTTTTVHAPTTELNVVYNCIIYFFCCVPGALSAIYKEYALQTQPMDMYYLNLWVTFFQFIILIPLAPIGFHYQSWSIQSNDSNWSDFRHLFENIGMGIDCWLKGNNPSADYRDGAVVIGAEYAQCEVRWFQRMHCCVVRHCIDLILFLFFFSSPVCIVFGLVLRGLYFNLQCICHPINASRCIFDAIECVFHCADCTLLCGLVCVQRYHCF